MTHQDPNKQSGLLDNPEKVRKLIIALLVVCAALFLADLLYEKHPYFEVENWFGFYAILGFVVCVALVLVARIAQVFLMREEDYYDRHG